MKEFDIYKPIFDEIGEPRLTKRQLKKIIRALRSERKKIEKEYKQNNRRKK